MNESSQIKVSLKLLWAIFAVVVTCTVFIVRLNDAVSQYAVNAKEWRDEILVVRAAQITMMRDIEVLKARSR